MTTPSSALLLVAAVALVGVLHTLVPDHWAPIAMLSRQRGWSVWQTARTAAVAGLGHTISTLLIAIVVWLGGTVLAVHYGQLLSTASSVALIAFGGWIALTSLLEIRSHDRDHAHFGHAHAHRHDDGLEHRHWHNHHEEDWHERDGNLALAPAIHNHAHRATSRTALLLILGSSPMIEGIPPFFAASRFGAGLLTTMTIAFAASTITTYIVVSVASARGIRNLSLGPVERYGEVVSGAFIAVLGVVFFLFPQF
jgi:hypothetical protein